MSKEIKIPEMTYVRIAEPFGKQVREMIQKAYAEGYEQAKFDAEMESLYEPTEDITYWNPQFQRDRIVEQAKKDIKILAIGNDWIPPKSYPNTVELVVNRGKRTVVALIKEFRSGKVIAKGIAKCAPDDCFNSAIGKAIALRRALGLEVPAEYLNAPQPTEVRVGDIVKIDKRSAYAGGKITTVIKEEAGAFEGFVVDEYNPGRSDKMTWVLAEYIEGIIDDSREDSE